MITYTLKVVEIRQETSDTITLCFKQPALKKIKYVAGQYLTLIFRINGRRYIRPYSFSSTPIVDQFLEVSIKRVPNGLVSNHIHDVIKVGDSIEVMQPMGDFIYTDENSLDHVFLWGMGSGITPLFSIAKDILNTHQGKKVSLIYGNRNHESTIFFKEIEKLLNDFENFNVYHFHTQLAIDAKNSSIVQGRIGVNEAAAILTDAGDVGSSAHFICGSNGLKESVKTVLAQFNVNPEFIYSEDFELVKNPADFEDINTETVQLKFMQDEISLEVVKGKTILEAALDANIELPYSCQTGNCNTCLGVLKEGAAKMIGIERRNDLMDNEFLLCCTHPISNNVYLEIN